MNPPSGTGRRASIARAVVLTLIIFLPLGVALNIAIAWVCAARVSMIDHASALTAQVSAANLPPGFSSWSVTRRDAFGSCRLAAMVSPSAATPAPNWNTLFPYWCDLQQVMQQRLDEVNAWPITHAPPNPPRPVCLVADARGWPFLALKCSWDYGTTSVLPPPIEPLEGGIGISRYGSASAYMGSVDDERALPYLVIWPGFIANTLIYALALWLVFAAMRSRRWRRQYRLNRGQCPHCGYPIGSNEVCTECGAEIPRALKQVL